MMSAITNGSREIWQKPIQAGFAGFAVVLLAGIFWLQNEGMKQSNVNMQTLLNIQERSLEQRRETAAAIERNTAATKSMQQAQETTTWLLASLRRCIELRFGPLDDEEGGW